MATLPLDGYGTLRPRRRAGPDDFFGEPVGVLQAEAVTTRSGRIRAVWRRLSGLGKVLLVSACCVVLLLVWQAANLPYAVVVCSSCCVAAACFGWTVGWGGGGGRHRVCPCQVHQSWAFHRSMGFGAD